MILTITKVRKSTRGRDASGTFINFLALENISSGQFVSVEFERELIFEVVSLETEEGLLNVQAVGVGMGVRHAIGDDFDIRKLMGCEISMVTDKDKIKKIREESLYC